MLKRVTGNNKQTQHLEDVEIASALKGSNFTNPRSGGTNLVEMQVKVHNMQPRSPNSNQQVVEIGNVLDTQKLTDTPQPSTDTTIPIKTTEIAEQLTLMDCRTLTLSLADSLAKVSQLLESGEDLKIQEALCSLKSLESLGLKDLVIYGLKTSRDSSAIMRAIPLRQSSERLMNWGMTVNGKCLTARITEFPKTGKGCSLSEILETDVDPKYFLSEKSVSGILRANQMIQNRKSLELSQVDLERELETLNPESLMF